MTQREKQVLQYVAENPMISQQELADRLGITRSSAAVHVSNLMKKGYIAGKGYVLRTRAYAVVIGGVNVDIGGRSFSGLIPADSNPGKITISPGGVGRNIAHNLSLLGIDVRLLTALGEDLYGRQIASSCAEQGIDLSRALRIQGAATSTYLYIAGPEGDMALAVSDMEICKKITPVYLSQELSLINNARVVVVDANIPQESLEYLSKHCTAPLFCDPVSTKKAEKLRPILHKLHTIKPNRLEAELLSGVAIHTELDLENAATALLEKGVQRLFISLGKDGVLAADKTCRLKLSNLPGDMVNTTGCGDAFMAALVWAWIQNQDFHQTALAGLAASAIAMESGLTINPALNSDALKARMKQH